MEEEKMSIRNISYQISASGITPENVQEGGMQNEHRATKLNFQLESSLFDGLKAKASALNGVLYYRFDGYDSAGNEVQSEQKTLDSESLDFYLEEWITRHSGKISVILIITLIKENKTETELVSYPARLNIKSKPFGNLKEKENRESVTTVAESAKNSALSAENSLREVNSVKNLINSLKNSTEQSEKNAENHAAEAKNAYEKFSNESFDINEKLKLKADIAYVDEKFGIIKEINAKLNEVT